MVTNRSGAFYGRLRVSLLRHLLHLCKFLQSNLLALLRIYHVSSQTVWWLLRWRCMRNALRSILRPP
eukprot:SAG31_NODE_36874_length_309_cov_0.990476_1_plen_66_part_10